MRLAAAVMRRPGASLPRQCGSWADLKAAYRLLSNADIDAPAIGEPHRRATRAACAPHPLVLCVQDDTHLRGCDRMQHTTLAVLPDGQLLGVLDQRFFARVETPADETRLAREARWRESCVWSDAVRAVGPPPEAPLPPPEAAPPGQCRFVHVADRAADDLNFMEACEAAGSGFIVRARHDRRIQGEEAKIWAFLRAQSACGTLTVEVGAQRNAQGRITRRARSAEVSIHFAPVTLQPPFNHPGTHAPRPVWAVWLHEEAPPPEGDDTDAIDWMLLTSERVDDEATARTIISAYQRRWVIEEWHRALKEGCRAEMSQLDEPEDHLRLAALLSVIAVRLLQLRDLADPASAAADDVEALRRWAPPIWITVVAKLGKHDADTLTPRQFMLTIAKRGGYLGRTRDPRPGWLVLWRGWSDISLLVEGAELAINQKPFPT